jgi:phosphatidylglycerophosphate synthase
MLLTLRKQHIPWLMAATRATLGPIVILGQACRWNGITLAALIVAALLSDVFDGILARRWHCDTPAVRLFDSMADNTFYFCVGIAVWLRAPGLIHTQAPLFLTLLTLEAAGFIIAIAKFGKPASYHSYLAKTWGLVLATAIVSQFITTHANPLIAAALIFGIICNLESLTMSLILPDWVNDVKTLPVALRLRTRILAHQYPRRSSKPVFP